LTAQQVVDYKAHDAVHSHLQSSYSNSPFDTIFDTVGADDVWDHCASYLKPSGSFISIVGGYSQGIYPFVRNQIRPTFLGNVPRRFRIIGLSPNGKAEQRVVELVAEGAIKEVPIDEEVEMEDAVKVRKR
jgi:NADPH:quinone reductase-like Zn-dependent oxidoreductase